MNYELARNIKPSRFPQTFCSQCGGEFGPGNFGYSHCKDHGGGMVKSIDKGIYEFAEKLVVGSGNGPEDDARFSEWVNAQAQDLAEQIQQAYDDWLMVD